jgi:hypothetical protein
MKSGLVTELGVPKDGRMRRKKPDFALVVSVRRDNGQDAGLGSAEVPGEGAAAQLDEGQGPESRECTQVEPAVTVIAKPDVPQKLAQPAGGILRC